MWQKYRLDYPKTPLPLKMQMMSSYLPEIERLLHEEEWLGQSLVVAEIGVWVGYTLIGLTKLLSQDAKVFGIDHFQGSVEHHDPENHPDWTAMLPTLAEQCLSNIQHEHLDDRIVILKANSCEAARTFPDHFFDLVLIDASHDSWDVMNDILAWWPTVREGGILGGDDIKSLRVQWALKMLGFPICHTDNLWWRKKLRRKVDG